MTKLEERFNALKELLKTNTFKESMLEISKTARGSDFSKFVYSLYDSEYKSFLDEVEQEIIDNTSKEKRSQRKFSMKSYLSQLLQGRIHKCSVCGNYCLIDNPTCSRKCQGKSDAVKEHRKNTNLERYGVENCYQSEEFKQKIRNTNLERYGVEHHLQTKKCMDKQRATNLERYGVECSMRSDIVKEKIISIWKKKHGVFEANSFFKNTFRMPHQHNIKNEQNLNYEYCQRFIKDGLFDVNEFAVYFNVSLKSAYVYKRKLKIDVPCSLDGSSKAERDLSDFIQNVLDDLCAKHKIPKVHVLKNDRSVITPLELDIYIPDLKLAIEYNGIYWHSLKDKYYHFNKSMLCYNKGIRLIHVYEEIDDISKVKDLLKTVITSKLSNEHLCVTQESFKESLKIDLSKDDPFIPGYSIKEILEPIQISENLYNAGYFVLQKDV